MGFWLNLRLKVRNFFKKHKKKIAIIIIAVGIVIAIDRFLASLPEEVTPSTTYEPHTPVMTETAEVPEEYKEPINNLINNYVEYCNNKEYENAYNLLSEEFKTNYCDTIEKFKEYVDELFDKKKIYNIQNFSNVDGAYVYRIRLLEDILATGTTNGYEYKEEKIVIKEENGVLKLALNGYVGDKQLGIIAEDEYMKINIVKKNVKYDTEVYTVEFTNKTSNYITIADNTESDEVLLKLTNTTRKAKNLQSGNIKILPNSTYTRELTFSKYYDSSEEAKALIFNAIRVLPKFSSDLNSAVKLYSLTVNLKPQN